MPIDARLQPILDGARSAPAPDPSLSTSERRAHAHTAMELSFMAFAGAGPEVASVVDHTVAVDGGEITVRVYTPAGGRALPAHLYIHGGGFWIGTLDHFDVNCRATAVGAGCVVASVDYRLAPEFHFPTAPEDCYAALRWLVDHAGELGVDPSRISVGGGSAGGNLAAVVALMAHDRGGPPLVFEVLEIPVTDLTIEPAVGRGEREGYMLTGGNGPVRRLLPRRVRRSEGSVRVAAARRRPLRASSALVMTMEFDPLRDEGEAYGRRLQEAGVPTTVRRWDGQIHGSASFAQLVPDVATEYREMVYAALRRRTRANRGGG